MKTFFVVNPRSANGDTGKRWPEILATVTRAMGEVGTGYTQGPMDAARLAREALKQGYRCIVAVGGDGTINEVTNGFFEGGKAIDPEAALGVLPRGTGGDFRKTFGWATDLQSNLARIARGDSKPFDVGLLEFTDHDGRPATRYFANICSFGASGQVDKEVNKSSKILGALSFKLGAVKALLKYSDAKVRVSFDGKPAELLDVTTLSVANGKFFGGGMKVAPNADPHDGQFDVTLWSGLSLADFALRQGELNDGTHLGKKGSRGLRCLTLEATCDTVVLIDCDGEQPGRLPCKMRILPAAIRVNV